MAKERADLGFGGDISLDLNDFQPKRVKPAAAPKPAAEAKAEQEAVKTVAKAAGFVSRPTEAAVPARQQRRRTTGRNVQFNIKAKQETIDRFVALADANGWVFGEALERAVDALEKAERS